MLVPNQNQSQKTPAYFFPLFDTVPEINVSENIYKVIDCIERSYRIFRIRFVNDGLRHEILTPRCVVRSTMFFASVVCITHLA